MHRHSRLGTTLVELVIAIAILGTVMVITMQFSLSARDYSALSTAQDEIAEDIERITRTMAEDMSLSGWALSATASFAGGSGLPATVVTDRANARYFPYVLVYGDAAEDPAISGGGFAHARIASDFLPDQVAITKALTGQTTVSVPTGWTAYRKAAVGPSHALVALTLQQGTWSAVPGPQNAGSLNFGARDDSDLPLWTSPDNHTDLGVLLASPFEESYSSTVPTGTFTRVSGISTATPYGITQDSLVLREQSGQFTLLPQWATIEAPLYDGTDGNDPSTAAHFTGWREYLYVVIRPPASTGGRLGRLVRARKVRVDASLVPGVEEGQLISSPSAPFGFVVDKKLSDNVVRVILETSRSAPVFVAPPVDQIRMTVFLVRPLISSSDPNARVPRQATFLFTMRTEARSTIKGETTLTPDAVITSAPHPSYPVAP